MSALLGVAPPRRTGYPAVSADPARIALARLVDRIASLPRTGRLACWQPSGILCARRWHRVPWKTPLLLTPWDDAANLALGSPLEVMGRDLSVNGASFEHADPLQCRQILLQPRDPSADPLAFVITLRWCRFTRAGVYQSGGRFESVLLRPSE